VVREVPEDPDVLKKSEESADALALPTTRFTLFRPLWIFVVSVALVALFWCSTADFFDTPTDVYRARQSYFSSKKHFFNDQSAWSSEWITMKRSIKNSLENGREHEIPLLLESVTPQLILAFLNDEIGVDEARLNAISIMPKRCGSTFMVMVSKPEPTIWPFSAMLTLEIECHISLKGVSLVCTRLRRGSQELSPNLTWAYFGSDLELLKRFSAITIKTPG
jgi:hypothetical protein